MKKPLPRKPWGADYTAQEEEGNAKGETQTQELGVLLCGP